MFGIYFNFSIVVLRTKSNHCLLKTRASFLNFVVKTALIWLALSGFFCVSSQSDTSCNLHLCYKFALLLQKNTPFSQSELSNFFVYIIILMSQYDSQGREWLSNTCSLQKLSKPNCCTANFRILTDYRTKELMGWHPWWIERTRIWVTGEIQVKRNKI